MKKLTEEHIKKAVKFIFNQPPPKQKRSLHLRNSHFIIVGDYFERVCTEENCKFCSDFSESINQEISKQLMGCNDKNN